MRRVDLLEAILAAPDEDAPRIAYGNWLLEQGDPRGELILSQCELAHTKARPRRRELLRRIAALLDANRSSWEAPLRRFRAVTRGTGSDPLPAVLCVTFRRGFVDALELPFDDYVAHAAGLLAEAPLLSTLELRGIERGASVDGVPWPEHLYALHALDADRAWLQRFFALPVAQGIRALSLRLDTDRMQWLLESPALAKLESLRVLAKSKEVGELARLAKVLPAMRELEIVGLRAPGPSLADALATLLEGTPALESLTLRNLDVGDDGVAQIAASGRRLSSLCLMGEIGMGPRAARALAASPHLAGIERLWLSARLGPDDLAALCSAFPDADAAVSGTIFGLNELLAVGDWVTPGEFPPLPRGSRARADVEAIRNALEPGITPRWALERLVAAGVFDPFWLHGEAFHARSFVECESCHGTGQGDWENPCYRPGCVNGLVPRYTRANAPGAVDDVLELARDPEGLRAALGLARSVADESARWSGSPPPAIRLRLGQVTQPNQAGLESIYSALRHLVEMEGLASNDLARARVGFALAAARAEAVQGNPRLAGRGFAELANPFESIARARELGYELEVADDELVIGIE